MKQARIDPPDPLRIDSSCIFEGDAHVVLARLPDQCAQSVVTSPPYWGLRDYDLPGQIGLEETLPQYLNRLVAVFAEIRRVLKDDGTLWLNIGDGYTSGNRGWRAPDKKNAARAMEVRPDTPEGLKPKDLLGIPWRLALRLQEDGWYLRSDIIWHKPNAMPESVKDRPTRAHEYIFLLSKREQYYYDRAAVLEANGRNRRSVWSVNTLPAVPAARGHVPAGAGPAMHPCVDPSRRPRAGSLLRLRHSRSRLRRNRP